MKFLLARHAEAVDGPQLQTDRGLTAKGESQLRVMRDFLESQTDKISTVICSSDLQRGIETGEYLADKLGAELVQTPLVDPPNNEGTVADSDVSALWKFIRKAVKATEGEVLVISHGPLVNALAAFLIGSDQGTRFHFSHGAIAHFDTETPADYEEGGRGESVIAYLHWFASCKMMLRAMEQDDSAVIEEALKIAEAMIASASEAAKGLRHPRHARHVAPARKAIAAVMRSYFQRQSKGVLKIVRANIKRVISTHGLKEAANGKAFAWDLLPSTLRPLTIPLLASEVLDYETAIESALAGSAKAFAAQYAAGEAPNSADLISAWLRDHSLEKITGDIADESLDRLRNAIAAAWEAGGTSDQLVGAVKDVFADFSDARAQMIAQTEVNDAYNQGQMGTAKDLGFDEKSWDPDGDACAEICQPNVDQGWIDIDEDFDSGDDAPTAHPWCDCSLSFRKGAESTEDEQERWGVEEEAANAA